MPARGGEPSIEALNQQFAKASTRLQAMKLMREHGEGMGNVTIPEFGGAAATAAGMPSGPGILGVASLGRPAVSTRVGNTLAQTSDMLRAGGAVGPTAAVQASGALDPVEEQINQLLFEALGIQR